MPLDTKPSVAKPTDMSTTWWGANMFAKITITSAAISVATTPLGVIITHAQMGSLNRLAFGSILFRGLGPNLICGQQRGAATILAKTTAAHGELKDPDVIEQRGGPIAQYAQLGIFSQTDVMVAQIYSNKSKLYGAGILDPKVPFKMSLPNVKQLFTMGYLPKSAASTINFASVCFLSDQLAGRFTFNSKLMNDLAGGAAAGVVAATATHIPIAIADSIILNTTVSPQGQLSRMTNSMFFKSCKTYIHDIGIKQAASKILQRTLLELPLRCVNGMVVFAIIQASMGLMGDEPLSTLRKKFSPEEATQNGPEPK